jgi:hypothetical protein
MFSQLIACALVGLASLVAASDPTTPQLLRARSNATSLAYNGFYLATYHEGAGFDDATLVANVSSALGGAFLNATANVTTDEYYLDFNTSIASTGASPIYYHAQISSGSAYDSLNILTLNLAQDPTPGFSFDDEGRLAWQNSTGWAACEWTHMVCLFMILLIVGWISFCVLGVSCLCGCYSFAMWMC